MPVRAICLSAGAVNLIVAALFLAAPGPIWRSMTGMDAPPGAAGVLAVFAAAVGAFGLGYIWAGLDFQRNRAIIRLAVYGKLAAFALAGWGAAAGGLALSGLAGAGIDLVYGALFALSLRSDAGPQPPSGGA